MRHERGPGRNGRPIDDEDIAERLTGGVRVDRDWISRADEQRPPGDAAAAGEESPPPIDRVRERPRRRRR